MSKLFITIIIPRKDGEPRFCAGEKKKKEMGYHIRNNFRFLKK